MADIKKLDPEAALASLDRIIDAEEDESIKEELKAVRAKPLPEPNQPRPSFEDEAGKRSRSYNKSRSPPMSLSDSARRVDLPSQEEVENILLSDTPLDHTVTKTVLLGLYQSMELHHQYVDDALQNITAAIESLNRKSEFLSVPTVSQAVPIKESKPSLFSLPKGDIVKYVLNPPVTRKTTKMRLRDIVREVEGPWISPDCVEALPDSKLVILQKNWNETAIRSLIEVRDNKI